MKKNLIHDQYHCLFQYGNEAFQRYIEELEEANKLELEAKVELLKAQELENIASYILLNSANEDAGNNLKLEALKLRQAVAEMVHEICMLFYYSQQLYLRYTQYLGKRD